MKLVLLFFVVISFVCGQQEQGWGGNSGKGNGGGGGNGGGHGGGNSPLLTIYFNQSIGVDTFLDKTWNFSNDAVESNPGGSYVAVSNFTTSRTATTRAGQMFTFCVQLNTLTENYCFNHAKFDSGSSFQFDGAYIENINYEENGVPIPFQLNTFPVSKGLGTYAGLQGYIIVNSTRVGIGFSGLAFSAKIYSFN